MKSGAGKKICDCDQAASLKKTGKACVHWESLLGPAGGRTGSQKLWVSNVADTGPSPEDLLLTKESDEQLARACGEDIDSLPHLDDEDRFRFWLKAGTSLSASKINILALRECRGLTFREIAEVCGYKQAAHAGQAYRDAIKFLRRTRAGRVQK